MFDLKNLMLCGAVLASGWLGAEVLTFNKPSDWQHKSLKANGENGVKGTIRTMLSSKMITLDKNKKYFLTGNIKAAESSKGGLYFGFRIYDDKGVQLQVHNCVTINNTDTVLLESTEPSDDWIKVKDASKWKVHPYNCAAFNTKPDKSDLPNRNIINAAPTKIVKEKDGWIIHFNKPINVVLPAGTGIREHSRGGEYYAALGSDKKPIALKNSRIWWWGGISKVRVLVNGSPAKGSKTMTLELSDIKLESK